MIPQPSIDRLEAMGRWLDVNGEAIYGATVGPVQGLEWCRTTAGPGVVFVHVFDWPADGALALPPVGGRVTAATLLAQGAGQVKLIEQSDERIVLQGPAEAPDAANTVIRLDIAP